MENQSGRVFVKRKHIVKRRQLYTRLKRTTTRFLQEILQEDFNEPNNVVIQENLQPVEEFLPY